MYLKNKIQSEDRVHFAGGPEPNGIIRKADLDQLDILRQLYPSRSQQFITQTSGSASNLVNNLATKSRNRLQKVKASGPTYNPRDSFTKLAKLDSSTKTFQLVRKPMAHSNDIRTASLLGRHGWNGNGLAEALNEVVG